jgi:hypothetical protein
MFIRSCNSGELLPLVLPVQCLVAPSCLHPSLQAAAGQQPRGQVSQEDAAKLLAEAAERDAAAGSLVMQLSSSGAGEPPEDWQAALSELPLSSPA